MSGFQLSFGFGHIATEPKQIEQDATAKTNKIKIEFRLAVSEYSAGRNFTTYIPCEALGGTAENILKFFKKGDVMYYEGKLKKTKGNAEKGLCLLVTKFHFTPREGSISPDNQPSLEEDNDIGDKE